jgi:serine/threonine protein kinase/WD40 repeat protein
MLMDVKPWFCANCGVGNSERRQTCFACQQPRLLHNRYHLLAPVGSGGFGVVYCAIDTQAGERQVALKQITLRKLSATEAIEATDAYHREVQLLSDLRHPGLPRLHEHFHDADNWYVVMDFVPGETLEHYLQNRITSTRKPGTPLLPLDEILHIGLQLCDILAYLHTRQPPVIFRDLKPDNIVRANRERLFLIDFGTARRYRPGVLKDTIPLGSPGYAAPEQYGRAQTTARSDIYSLGALLHFLLSGDDPADNPFQFSALSTGASATKKRLVALVARMVELEAEKRPASIRDIEDDLRAIRAGTDRGVQEDPASAWLYPAQPPRMWPRPVSSWSNWSAPLTPSSAQQQQMAQPAQKIGSPGRRTTLTLLGLIALGALGNGLAALGRPTSNVSIDGEVPLPQPRMAAAPGVRTLMWAANGLRLAYGYSDGSVRVIEMTGAGEKGSEGGVEEPGAVVFLYDGGYERQFALSPNGAWMAIATYNGVQIWDLTTQAVTEPTYYMDGGPITDLVWSANNQQLAVVAEGEVHVWDLVSQRTLFQLEINARKFRRPEQRTLTWSPDGAYLALDGPALDTRATFFQVWNVQRREMQYTFPTENAVVSSIWSSDSKYLALVDAGGVINVYQLANGQLAFTLNGDDAEMHTSRVLSWSPDGRYLVVVSEEDARMQIWKGQFPHYVLALTERLEGAQDQLALAWSPAGDLLIARADQTIEVKQMP